MSRTNLNAAQFQKCWDHTEELVRGDWNLGRGLRCSFTAKNVLFMLPTVVKHGGNWDILALMFKAKKQTFERKIMGFINLLSAPLCNRWVE